MRKIEFFLEMHSEENLGKSGINHRMAKAITGNGGAINFLVPRSFVPVLQLEMYEVYSVSSRICTNSQGRGKVN